MKKHLRILGIYWFLLPILCGAAPTEQVFLSGRDCADAVSWEFFCTAGRGSGEWATIPVPSNWEFHGFGNFDYGGAKVKSSEVGRYRHRFDVPSAWDDKRVFIVFEGVMTDTEVRINGTPAGPVHQGGFYQFKYEITDLVRIGEENLLEVEVAKVSANESVEQAERQADYWVFGGIFRPVYLDAVPREYIDWMAVDARADGSFLLDVYMGDGEPGSGQVRAEIRTLDGQSVQTFSGERRGEKTRITGTIPAPRLWTAETPSLYEVVVTLEQDGEDVHTVSRRFGFRTFEVRTGEGLFLNGQRIVLKGVNRHSFRPESGRCLSRQDCIDDVELIKDMNMNAVRMSHYPPDAVFLDECDARGLYVLDELAGWQKPSYDTPTARRLVGQMVRRDQMHPSILFWDNANEGGWNRDVDGDFALYDPQDRPVLHPWEEHDGVQTDHYETYESTGKYMQGPALHMPTEFLHGLYDGGHGAGLNDYWNLLTSSPFGAGGFLWALADEGVVRGDRGGVIDVDGNHAPDGIVGPHHDKEGSFYTIKEIWSPIQVLSDKVSADLDGILVLRNDYSFRNLRECRFDWELVSFSDQEGRRVLHSGSRAGPDIAPGEQGELRLALPPERTSADALSLKATDWTGRELWTWSWALHAPSFAEVPAGGSLNAERIGDELVVTAGEMRAAFDASSGMLRGIRVGDQPVPLARGPRRVLAGGERELLTTEPAAAGGPALTWEQTEKAVEIAVSHPGNGLETLRWRVFPSGIIELDCSYRCEQEVDVHGITFDFPEDRVRAKTWLGNGPYRVWQNRMRGTRFGLWQCDYNDPTPGEEWVFPEFKGYFANVHWLQLDTSDGPINVATDTPDLFLGLFAPKFGKDPKNATAALPEGDISFLHAIAPIGSKFHHARDFGPESQLSLGEGTYPVRLRFSFQGIETLP